MWFLGMVQVTLGCLGVPTGPGTKDGQDREALAFLLAFPCDPEVEKGRGNAED